MEKTLVCGDIGGTKALLGIATAAAGRVSFAYQRRYECADFADFAKLFDRFRQDASPYAATPTGGCLALAGPIEDDGLSARITNLPWRVEARAAGAAFGLPPLQLVNDFAAAAMGIAAAEDLVTLQTGEPLATGVRLVVGAGTGLGMAMLVPIDQGWRVLPGEGGHCGFSPQDETQARVHAALLAEHGRVTVERVVSGPGLAAIHRILAGAASDPETIAAQALAGDPAARRSLEVFLAAYGAFAGDMALACMARGGVYLAGGIAAKVLPALQSGGFNTAFGAKAEHAALAARMPVHIVVDPDLGLKGAALIAGAV